MSCPPGGPVQGECCGGCHPQPVPLLTPPLMPNAARDGSCPATDGLMEEISSQDSAMELPVGDRKGERLPFQIFPDPVEAVAGTEGSLGCPQERERLPSIVVEPTDVSEVESGELRWPPEDMDFEDEEDLFLEQCIPPANIADWGEDEDEEEEEEGEEDDDSADLQSDEEFRDSSSTLLHDSAPALN